MYIPQTMTLSRFSRLAATPALGLWLAACSHSSGTPADTGDGAAPNPLEDVLTQRGDISRTGVDSHETVLTQSSVRSSAFGKRTAFTVDGQIYAQPLYVSGYAIGGKTRNVLVVATGHNSVFAFDADTGASVWPAGPTNLGPSVPNTVFSNNAIPNEVGIMSTPVIDRVNGLIYLANVDYVGSVVSHRVHVLSLATGQEMKGSPVLVNPAIPGTVDHGTTLAWNPLRELQRASLLLLDGTVYVAYASQFDRPTYHGFILGYQYDAAAGMLTQKVGWSASQDGTSGGIWQSGQGLTVDSANNIYAMIGNGTTSVLTGGTSYGEAFVKLSPSLKATDWFVPANYEELNEDDLDVGAGGPLLIPGTSPPLMVGVGKQGLAYVVDTSNLGHMAAGDTQIVQEFPVLSHGQFFGSPLVWAGGGATRLYVWCTESPLTQFVLSGNTFNTTPVATSVATTPFGYNPTGVLTLSSNADSPGSAILWASKPTADPNSATVPGILYAFDPITLDELWDSGQAADNSLGEYAKFVPPTVANGKVYMATNSGQVAVYGLQPGASTGSDADVDTQPDAALDAGADVPVYTLDAGVTWHSLYADYFGPSGVASCSRGTICHGSTSEDGYKGSHHFLCPGDASAECYERITSTGDGGVNVITPGASFSEDDLSEVLCQMHGTIGSMPLGCVYDFTPTDVERISAWIAGGAKNN